MARGKDARFFDDNVFVSVGSFFKKIWRIFRICLKIN